MSSDHDRAGGLGVVMSGGYVHSQLGTTADTQESVHDDFSETHCKSAWRLSTCHTVLSGYLVRPGVSDTTTEKVGGVIVRK